MFLGHQIFITLDCGCAGNLGNCKCSPVSNHLLIIVLTYIAL